MADDDSRGDKWMIGGRDPETEQESRDTSPPSLDPPQVLTSTSLPPSSTNAREFRRLMEALRDGVAIISASGLLFENSAMARLFPALDPTLQVPHLFRRFVRSFLPAHRGEAAMNFAALIRGSVKESEFEYTIQSHAGREERILHLSCDAITFNESPALLLTARDISDSREIQEKLGRAERMASIGTLAAGVAHEINNPLAYVTTNIAYCVERLRYIDDLLSGRAIQLSSPASLRALLSPMAQALKEAHEGTMRVATIVRDLRTLTREDQDALSPVDLPRAIETALHMAESEYRFRAQIVREFSAARAVLGNETRLVQVFVNLIVNAAQAFVNDDLAHNRIWIRARVEGATTIVEVRDNGRGIPLEEQDRIFAPFFTTKAVGVGTGLGLSICHGIVYAIGGTISVESSQGAGATFRVTLRTSDELAPPSKPRPPSTHPDGRARILIVDDEPLILRSISRLLRDQHDVEIAGNGHVGLERIVEDGPFDLIICDLMMPEMNGMELYEEVRRRSPETADRFVFLTGGAFTERARAFLTSIDNPKLDKPIQPTLLRNVVKGALVR